MKKISILLLSLLVFGYCWADNESIAQEKVKHGVQSAFPEITVDSVESSPIQGLYKLSAGPLVLYASHDGHYLIAGDVFDLAQTDKDKRNLTEALRREARVEMLKAIKSNDMVVFTPKEVKAVVTVFTDPDCGYCRKLHSEVPQLLENGVEVRYLAFPREGNGSAAYNKMTSIWCSKDRQQAMSMVMEGKEIESVTCSVNLDEQFMLGQKLGVNGTPTLFFPDGSVVGGYLPAEKLVKEAIKHNVVK